MTEFIFRNEVAIRFTVFLTTFLLLALWEWQWPRRVLTQNKLQRWLNNVVLMVTGALLVRVMVPIVAVGAAYLAEQQHLGFSNHFELPPWLEVTVVFVLLDLSMYFQHAMFHVMPILWRFHRVHHTDMDFDVTTGVRFHPLEILLSMVFKIMLILAWGAPVLAVILFETSLNFMSMFTHSNIHLNEKLERVLRWFVVTPDMHRVHHSVQENETNSNFAFNISVWDRFFGTYKAAPEAGQQGVQIGLNGFQERRWQTYTGLLLMPFASNIGGYAINYRDTKNAVALAQAKEIARQHEARAKLAIELESYLQAVGQHALVSVTDSTGCIIEVNDKFCEISGYERSELLGQNHRIVNSGMHEKGFFDDMWAAICSGKKWHGEVCNRAKDGELYWVDSAIVPIRGVDGEIERYISVRVDVSKRKKYELGIEKINQALTDANIQLKTLSRVDALTGIANRRHFDNTLANYVSTMGRADVELTLIFCDVDYFKNYNDAYGHQAGDACLQNIAKAIELSFSRAGDLVARYGGEEFAVILPNVDNKIAVMLAERMRASIEALKLKHSYSSAASVVTVSVGVITQVPTRDLGAIDFISKADAALYRAKDGGRNRVESNT